jgi:hypothetical protein
MLVSAGSRSWLHTSASVPTGAAPSRSVSPETSTRPSEPSAFVSRSPSIMRTPEIDLVISENERFATVEKLIGIPARIARAANPRR